MLETYRVGRMADNDKKTPLAVRLRQAADKAGLKAEPLAEILGCSPSAVWAWWSGRNEPSIESLVAYARVVGADVEYLAAGEKTTSPGDFADWFFDLVDQIMSGKDPGPAFDQATGSTGALSDRERRSLSRRVVQFRRFIEEEAGRSWASLSPQERRQVVDRLLVEESL